MPARAADAPLEPHRVAAVAQQRGIVVGFEQQCIATLQRMHHGVGRLADVRQDADAVHTVAAAQLQGFGGVVGHRKGQHTDRADDDGFAVARHAARGCVVELGRRCSPGSTN